MIPSSSSILNDPPSADDSVSGLDPLPTAYSLPTHPRRRYPRRLRPDSSHPYTQGLPANVPYNPAPAPVSEPSAIEEEPEEDEGGSHPPASHPPENKDDPPPPLPSTSADGGTQQTTSKVVIPVEEEMNPQPAVNKNTSTVSRRRAAFSKLSLITRVRI